MKRTEWNRMDCSASVRLKCQPSKGQQIALVCVFSKKNSRHFSLLLLLINNLPLHQIILITCEKRSSQAPRKRESLAHPCNEKTFCEHMPTIYCLFCLWPCSFFAFFLHQKKIQSKKKISKKKKKKGKKAKIKKR